MWCHHALEPLNRWLNTGQKLLLYFLESKVVFFRRGRIIASFKLFGTPQSKKALMISLHQPSSQCLAFYISQAGHVLSLQVVGPTILSMLSGEPRENESYRTRENALYVQLCIINPHVGANRTDHITHFTFITLAPGFFPWLIEGTNYDL